MRALVHEECGGRLDDREDESPQPGPAEVSVEIRGCNVPRTIENAIRDSFFDDFDSVDVCEHGFGDDARRHDPGRSDRRGSGSGTLPVRAPGGQGA